jgi:hypothetical protein
VEVLGGNNPRPQEFFGNYFTFNYKIADAGWALPTVNGRDRWYLVANAHPWIWQIALTF